LMPATKKSHAHTWLFFYCVPQANAMTERGLP
jgi:hypothetical protein